MLLFVLLLLLGGGLVVVLKQPEVVLNEGNVKKLTYFIADQGVGIRWSDLKIAVNSDSLFKKNISFEFENICVFLPLKRTSGCASKIKGSFKVDLVNLEWKLGDLSKFGVSEMNWRLPSEPSEQPITGRINLQSGAIDKNRVNYHLWGALIFPDRKQPRNIGIDSHLALHRLRGKGLKGSYELEYAITGRLLKNKNPAWLTLTGRADSKSIAGRITGLARNQVPQVKSINVDACSFSFKGGTTRDLDLNCTILTEFSLTALKPLKLPQRFKTNLNSNLRFTEVDEMGIPSAKTHVTGPLTLTANTFGQNILKINTVLTSDLHASLGDAPSKWFQKAHLDANLDVVKFHKLVAHLKHTAWEIPAPLEVLKGKMSFKMAGDLDPTTAVLPLSFQTNLGSQNQKLVTRAEGVFKVLLKDNSFHPHLDLVVTLPNVQLELPKLGLEVPPQLIPDARVKTKHPQTTTSPTFEYQVTINTPDGKPIRLLSNLAQEHIPIKVSVTLKHDQPPEGGLRVEGFPIEFFNRKASVTKMFLNLKNPIEQSEVDGWIDVNYADYNVTIRVYSTIKNPQVKLSSDPPLAENQVIAVLLFGQTLNELDPDQTASVGYTQAALTNRAINLASLYLLASTPIQSVGYDSSTGTVMVKLKIAEGTSLNLGNSTDTHAKKVGIQKRLGAHWGIKTELDHTSDKDTVTGYLEWHHRY